MKVIRVDSYDDEGPRGDQRLLAGPGLSPEVAEVVARALNDCPARLDHDYFRAVTDDYELRRSVTGSPMRVVARFWTRTFEDAKKVYYALNGWGDPSTSGRRVAGRRRS